MSNTKHEKSIGTTCAENGREKPPENSQNRIRRNVSIIQTRYELSQKFPLRGLRMHFLPLVSKFSHMVLYVLNVLCDSFWIVLCICAIFEKFI